MTKNSSLSRYIVLTAIIFCYLLPVSALIGYSWMRDFLESAWQQWSIGLLIASSGSLALFYLITRWEEKNLQPCLTVPDNPFQQDSIVALETFEKLSKEHLEAQESNALYKAKMEEMRIEMERISEEKSHFENLEARFQTELEACRSSAHEEMKQQQQFIRSLQQNLAEQKSIMEKKQQQIGQLESKVSDLTYEIKTLLQIAESHANAPIEAEKIETPSPYISEANSGDEEDAMSMQNEKQICTPEEASLQLRRCLDIAQKITGSNRFSQMSAFMDSPADSFSIDLRRLCESLRSEKSCAILFYSPKENQLLFANNQIRGLTGWSPEKFVQNFSRLLVDEIAWKNGVAALALRNEVHLKLSLKARTGNEVQMDAHLGMIPTGIFKYHTLAVLY